MTEKKKGLYACIIAAQKEFKTIGKNQQAGSGKFSYEYADLPAILEIVMPILNEKDMCLTQHTKVVDGNTLLVTKVTHIDGESIEGEYPVCSINGKHQDMGSALTYSRRYGLCSLLSISIGGEDDDGASASKVDKKAPPVEDTRTVMDKVEDFTKWLGNCNDMAEYVKAEKRAKETLKPQLTDNAWERVKADMSVAFARLQEQQGNV